MLRLTYLEVAIGPECGRQYCLNNQTKVQLIGLLIGSVDNRGHLSSWLLGSKFISPIGNLSIDNLETGAGSNRLAPGIAIVASWYHVVLWYRDKNLSE